MIDQKTPDQVYREIKNVEKQNLIDVRTVEEFDETHASGAINIPLDKFMNENPEDLLKGIEKDEVIYMICRSGARSMKAAELCENAGFKNLVNISGGTLDWIEYGLPVEN